MPLLCAPRVRRKTIGPMCLIAVLWAKPLFYFVAGRKDGVQEAAQDATAWSMLLLELCLPSVSTQISETFVCEHFPDEGKINGAMEEISCDHPPAVAIMCRRLLTSPIDARLRQLIQAGVVGFIFRSYGSHLPGAKAVAHSC